jgi:thiamine biosynthesis lipoprotein
MGIAADTQAAAMRQPGSFDLVDFARTGPSRRSRRDFLTGVPPAREDRADYWIRVHRRAMACRFEVTLASQDAPAIPAARAALDEIDRVEEELSVFRETSVVSRINRCAAGEPVSIDASVAALLKECARLHRDTAGAFDITSTPLSRCWGFLQREGRLPTADAIDAARSRVDARAIHLDPERGAVRLTRPGVEINLGAIGKGYALDRAGATMRVAGVAHALLSAGQSSLLAIGGRVSGWHVEIVSPRAGGSRLAQAWLRDAALGTSGAGEQFVIVDGVRYGHVIDPRTGWPASGVVSASAIASRAADADALSTAFLVGGAELARRYCEDHQDVMALVTLEGSDRPIVFGSHRGAVGVA